MENISRYIVIFLFFNFIITMALKTNLLYRSVYMKTKHRSAILLLSTGDDNDDDKPKLKMIDDNNGPRVSVKSLGLLNILL